jgi:hypothetical protein
MVRDRRPLRDVRPRRWSDLTDRQRTGVVTLGLIEVTLTVAAAVDLVRRPSGSVRGPKAVWWPAIFVQPIGPVAYLLVGRRR